MLVQRCLCMERIHRVVICAILGISLFQPRQNEREQNHTNCQLSGPKLRPQLFQLIVSTTGGIISWCIVANTVQIDRG